MCLTDTCTRPGLTDTGLQWRPVCPFAAGMLSPQFDDPLEWLGFTPTITPPLPTARLARNFDAALTPGTYPRIAQPDRRLQVLLGMYTEQDFAQHVDHVYGQLLPMADGGLRFLYPFEGLAAMGWPAVHLPVAAWKATGNSIALPDAILPLARLFRAIARATGRPFLPLDEAQHHILGRQATYHPCPHTEVQGAHGSRRMPPSHAPGVGCYPPVGAAIGWAAQADGHPASNHATMPFQLNPIASGTHNTATSARGPAPISLEYAQVPFTSLASSVLAVATRTLVAGPSEGSVADGALLTIEQQTAADRWDTVVALQFAERQRLQQAPPCQHCLPGKNGSRFCEACAAAIMANQQAIA